MVSDPGFGDWWSRRSTEQDRSGAETVEVSLPTPTTAVATYYIIATAEASSNPAV
ncbi:MAG: hypothetical protein R3F31_20655 [Verrucomicrobiales bacterium]